MDGVIQVAKKEVTLDYDRWAEEKINNEDKMVQDWNCRIFIGMLRNGMAKGIKRIAEVGGADGYCLSLIKKETHSDATNYEMAAPYVSKGRKEHPDIKFVQGDFMKTAAEPVDLIVFSDVVEHVEDDEKFMEKCARCGRYGLFKIPIEDAWYVKLQIAAGRGFLRAQSTPQATYGITPMAGQSRLWGNTSRYWLWNTLTTPRWPRKTLFSEKFMRSCSVLRGG